MVVGVRMGNRTHPCKTCNGYESKDQQYCDGCVFNDKGSTICYNTDCKYEEGGRCIAQINCDNCYAQLMD